MEERGITLLLPLKIGDDLLPKKQGSRIVEEREAGDKTGDEAEVGEGEERNWKAAEGGGGGIREERQRE